MDYLNHSTNFKRTTKVVEEGVANGRNVLLSLPEGVLLIEASSPTVVDNKIIGAVGVSGATSQQDSQIPEAGLASLKKITVMAGWKFQPAIH